MSPSTAIGLHSTVTGKCCRYRIKPKKLKSYMMGKSLSLKIYCYSHQLPIGCDD